MIPLARTTARVLLDTSPFISFAQGGALFQLAGYLGNRAAITLDVAEELRRNSTGRFPELKTPGFLAGRPASRSRCRPICWPTPPICAASTRPPAPTIAANRGDATALLAGRLADAVVIMDDDLGKRLCLTRGIPRLSTAQLAAEMVVAEALDDATGFAVFDAATPAGVGRKEFDEAVRRAGAS